MVTARSRGRLIGYSFDLTMPPGAPWWTDLVTDLEPGMDDEPSGRTFVLIELLVQADWQGKGVAARLHDQLLAGRPEERATLTARPDADVAQAAYARWGWQKVAQKRNPLPDSPIYDVLVKPLPSKTVD